MKNKLLVSILVTLMIAGVIGAKIFFINVGNIEERREKIIVEMFSLIEDMEENGKYKCCIEPPCTMCFLGHWLWENGSCYCDEMILKEEDDKVCPECKAGIREGRCKSELKVVCPIFE